jgi:hypothetical protein
MMGTAKKAVECAAIDGVDVSLLYCLVGLPVKRLVSSSARDHHALPCHDFACRPHLSVFRGLVRAAEDGHTLLARLIFSILEAVGVGEGVLAAIQLIVLVAFDLDFVEGLDVTLGG